MKLCLMRSEPALERVPGTAKKFMPIASSEFIDTNVLVYEWDNTDSLKRDIARKLVSRLGSRGVISSQVAQEFAWTMSKKLGISGRETALILKNYQVFRFVPIKMQLVQRALSTANDNIISFWDALIVEAAADAGCKVLLTEDLNDGQRIRGVRIVNPFVSTLPS